MPDKTKKQIDSEAAAKALDEKWYIYARGELPQSVECELCHRYGGKAQYECRNAVCFHGGSLGYE